MTLRQPLHVSLVTFLLLGATSILAAQEPYGEKPMENPLEPTKQVIAEGREIFNKSCTVCHGIDGAAGDRGPAMAAQRRYLRRTDEELFHAITDGIPGSEMPPMGLPKEDAWKVVAYIQSLRAKAIDVPVAGDAAHGSEIFWGKGQCGKCHVVRGRGGLLGPDLSNLAAEMSLNQIEEALTVAKPHPPLGYRPVTVTTRDGQTISGVSKNEHNFSLQMLGEDNRLHLFTKDELAEIEYDDESLMPTDYDERLSEKEFQDLLAFLSRLARSRDRASEGE